MSSDLKKINKKNSRRIKLQEPKFVERLIKISRVSKVTKGGKKLSFRAIVVVGDENGKVGVGVAKADDVVNAFKKAKTDGRKNLIKLPITKSLSIPHNVLEILELVKLLCDHLLKVLVLLLVVLFELY
jgi:small subunit ribosomal protein S5